MLAARTTLPPKLRGAGCSARAVPRKRVLLSCVAVACGPGWSLREIAHKTAGLLRGLLRRIALGHQV